MSNELIKAPDGVMQMQKTKQNGLSVFSDSESFNLACRMADALARSTIVPKHYQQNPSNCMIAIEMASRINTSPMMVMQNLYIVNGSPAWSSQWIIAMINNSKRYKTELKFDIEYNQRGELESCTAWAEDYNGNRVVGPKITMEMAKNEGWIGKSGSKWKTMPEVMIRYRAASFFGRLNCPDMIMGIYSQEEVIDGFGEQPDDIVVESAPAAAEDDRLITQQERQTLMDLISENFEEKDVRNGVYVEALASAGLTSSAKMTVGQLNQAIEAVKNIIAKESVPQEPDTT